MFDGQAERAEEQIVQPASKESARALLQKLGAPNRLLRHVDLVGEAAEDVLDLLKGHEIACDEDFVRVGVVLHDAGKIIHATELDRPGNAHEPAGEAMLLENGVAPMLARVCLSHARWDSMEVLFEELLIALSDKLWKGVRVPTLEEQVVDRAAAATQKDRWDLFIKLDEGFERIAAAGDARLQRSRP